MLSQTFEDIEILLSVREKRSERSYKLRFESRVMPKSTKNLLNSKFTLKFQEILNGNKLMRKDLLEGRYESSLSDEENVGYKFPFMQLGSELMSEGPALNKIIAF